MINISTYIKQTTLCTFTILFLLLFPATTSYSQAVQFSMDVKPELGIEVLQDLNFGTVVTNSGQQQVALGNPQMGIFKIKALAAQSALITLQKPEYLSSQDSDVDDRIPISLNAAYSRIPTGYNDILEFNNSLDITLGDGNRATLSPTWENGYVFIYGDIYVDEVSEGSYSGTLILNITYQ